MFFFKPRPPAPEFEPDTTRVRLHNGAYWPYDQAPDPYRVYTLWEWDEDMDSEFSEMAVECALEILYEYEIVVNCLWPHLAGGTVREAEDVERYLKHTLVKDFGNASSAVTMTRGPDRNLVAIFNHNDEFYQIRFDGYRMPPYDDVPRGKRLPPDVRLHFAHKPDRLIIMTRQGIDVFIHKLREVCGRYGKTVVMRGFPPHAEGK